MTYLWGHSRTEHKTGSPSQQSLIVIDYNYTVRKAMGDPQHGVS